MKYLKLIFVILIGISFSSCNKGMDNYLYNPNAYCPTCKNIEVVVENPFEVATTITIQGYDYELKPHKERSVFVPIDSTSVKYLLQYQGYVETLRIAAGHSADLRPWMAHIRDVRNGHAL